jgi:hypothetical protein
LVVVQEGYYYYNEEDGCYYDEDGYYYYYYDEEGEHIIDRLTCHFMVLVFTLGPGCLEHFLIRYINSCLPAIVFTYNAPSAPVEEIQIIS